MKFYFWVNLNGLDVDGNMQGDHDTFSMYYTYL